MSLYLSYEKRIPNCQYLDILYNLVSPRARLVKTRQGVAAHTLMQQTMFFDLANGFPMITERDVSSFWRKPIGELCAFINGARNLAELAEFGCDWWGPWATPEKSARIGYKPGELGGGSYGGAFNDFPSPDPKNPSTTVGFDQFTHMVAQIKEQPELRTHFISPWIPLWNARGLGITPHTTISPCHGWVHVRIIEDELHLHMFQRSGDVPVGVPANMIQYGALTLMLAQVTGHRPIGYYHTISDAHIYTDQLSKVRTIIRQVAEAGPRRLPTVTLTDTGRQITDIHDFRAEHFQLADYHPHPAVNGIPVAP